MRPAPEARWLVATGNRQQKYRDGRIIIEEAKDKLADALGPLLNQTFSLPRDYAGAGNWTAGRNPNPSPEAQL